MTPNFRSILGVVLSACLAVWVGINVAQEERAVAFVSVALTFWVVIAWWGGPQTEAWLLAFLIVGYVLGNRGFAQIRPAPALPLFFGELGLACTGALLAFRHARSRSLPVRRDWLHGTLLLWIALGLGRIVFDVRSYGFLALRDFALVYYSVFFFIAAAVARHEASRRLLATSFTVTFALLPSLALVSELFPEFFLRHLVVGGTPMIYYKDDLLATFLFAGFLWLLPRGSGNFGHDIFRWALALFALALGLTKLSRAGMVGLGVGVGWLALGGYWRPARTLAVVAAAGALTIAAHTLFEGRAMEQTKVYAIYEHVVSVADVGGRRQYQNQESTDSGDNNRFRLVWWKSVVDETLATNPALGLGFGHDLARNFVRNYDPLMWNDFTARSPHSVIVTTFGRMGALGLAALLAFFGALALRTARLANATRQSPAPATFDHLNTTAVAWVVLVSACFGVVLEGPMGAIPVWIMLGLAQAEDEAEPSQTTKPTM